MGRILIAEDDDAMRNFLARSLERAAVLAPAMKVVFITGFAAVALNHGEEPIATDARVLSKPFHLKDVVAAIDEMCAA